MKILPISDTHYEFRPTNWWDVPRSESERRYMGEADVVVCAGDMHTQGRGPQWLRQVFDRQEICYTPGNHEYFNSSIDYQDDLLRQECSKYGIHFLQRNTVEIGGTVFSGCTFWTDFELFGADERPRAMFETRRYLMDYHQISVDQVMLRKIAPLGTIEIHRKHLCWLQEQFEIHRGKPLVVVTHHCPSTKCVHPDYTEDPVSAGFCSDLDSLVEQSGAAYWICGHSHVAQQFQVGETTVIQNCEGYEGEHIPGFSGKTYEI